MTICGPPLPAVKILPGQPSPSPPLLYNDKAPPPLRSIIRPLPPNCPSIHNPEPTPLPAYAFASLYPCLPACTLASLNSCQPEPSEPLGRGATSHQVCSPLSSPLPAPPLLCMMQAKALEVQARGRLEAVVREHQPLQMSRPAHRHRHRWGSPQNL